MSKRDKIIYWIATLWLALGMLSTGAVQLLKAKAGAGGVNSVTHLGYPTYFLTILGIWKVLGVVAILIPKFPLLKEWAYAGFFFAMSGAIFSHLASGSTVGEILPSALLLVLTVISWYFRPADR
jgi:DoxX-like family